MSKLFAVRENLLNDKEQRKNLEAFIKRNKVPGFHVVQIENGQIVYKPLSKKVTDDSDVSFERKQATMISLFLIQEGEISSFFASEDVLLRHLESVK